MLKQRMSLIALGILSASTAMANDQEQSKGFVEDSHLNIAARNAYISRDYKNGKQDKAEWGQGFIGKFESGFTQGTVGVGVDVIGQYAIRLDGGKGRSGGGGIDFFKQGASGKAADDIAKAGAAVKVRVSNTVLKYGDQMPALPVLMYDNSRLMPESFTGTLLTSKEINGLEVNVGRFTAESRKSAEARDSGDLKSINVFGASYKFTDNLSASLYGSQMVDELNKQTPRWSSLKMPITVVQGAKDELVDPRTAAPTIARWLDSLGVDFHWRTAVTGFDDGVDDGARRVELGVLEDESDALVPESGAFCGVEFGNVFPGNIVMA